VEGIAGAPLLSSSPQERTRLQPMPETIVSVDHLTKRYGVLTAVDDITFHVRRGEIFGILGPNGAGKTTTLECIETLLSFDAGEIRLEGVDVRADPQEVKRRIGVQLQSSTFFDRLSLKELLSLFGEIYRRRVDPGSILDEVDLRAKLHSSVSELSGGQRQRFSIAAALVHDPPVLFLDEPTTGLDPQSRRHLWGVVRRIRDEGKTIVLTTHYMEEAEELCDRVAIMDHGRIIALAPPQELIAQLLADGFRKARVERQANLEDVFLALTGHALREE
jgi:ABC-2 type transport system ATP-binding protein